MDYLRNMVKFAAKHLDKNEDEIKVVWFSKTLQNAKIIFIVISPDNNMYEMTYNGTKNEYYLDKYVKEYNEVIKGE